MNCDCSLPPEMIGIILTKLDDLTALLKCRLVCRMWNTDCLKVLRQSRFRKVVGPSNLEKALQFVPSEGQFILPFRLKQILSKVETETGQEFEDICVQEFQETSLSVAQLFQLCGPECFPDYDLTLHSCGVRGLVALNEFLQTISANLKTFEFSFCPSDSLSCRETVEILRRDPVVFPNLKDLVCESCFFQGQDEDEGEADRENIESVLIENSHNLEALRLIAIGLGGQDESTATARHYMCNLWPKRPPAALKTLKRLAVSDIGNRVQFLQSLRASPFHPILQAFEFSTTTSSRVDQIYATEDILLFFSKTLKKVFVNLERVRRGGSLNFPIRFPRLPNLEQLWMVSESEGSDLYGLSFVNPLEFNLNQETLPRLRSVQIPFGCMIVPAAELQERLRLQQNLFVAPPAPVPPATTFPSVRHLSFKIYEKTFRDDSGYARKLVTWKGYDDSESEGVAAELPAPSNPGIGRVAPKTYLDLVSLIFPALASVTVFCDVKTPVEIQNVEIVSQEILQSRLGSVIETFQIQALDMRYVQKILEAAVFVNGLKNLKKLRISCLNYVESQCPSYLCPFCYVMPAPAEYFQSRPAGIQEIQICTKLMGENEAERLENVRVTQTKFPTWRVQLV